MKWDKQIIELFIGGLNRETDSNYNLWCHPDDVNRLEEAVDAIYIDPKGTTIAVEHTLVEMFSGQKRDDIPFNKVFGRLWADKSLAVPGRKVRVITPPFSIPEGVDWNLASQKIDEWFKSIRLALPDGKSAHLIPGLGFDLSLTIESMDITKWAHHMFGFVEVARILPIDSSREMLRNALARKLPKLVRTIAKMRILLLEYASPWSHPEITELLGLLGPDFPSLAKVETIWVVDTTPWQTGGCVFFQTVWPHDTFRGFLASSSV